MAPKLTKPEVREVLLRVSKNGLTHGQNLYNCVARGDADFLAEYGQDATLLSRAKAAVRNSKILYHVRQLMLDDIESYQYVEDHNSFYVRVENCLHVRFKKLDEHGRSSISKTQRDKQYRLQDGNCLPFVEHVAIYVNLDVGYTLNPTGAVSGISFSCCAPLNLGVYYRLPAVDLDIVEDQQPIFTPREEDIIPVLNLDLKQHLKQNEDGRQANGAL